MVIITNPPLNSMTNVRIGAVCAAAILSAVPFLALAADVRTGQQLSIGSGETITQNLYMAAGNIRSGAAVTGDEVLAGGSLIMNGTVSSNLLAAGGNISILGTVGNNIRALGGNILVSGKVGGDILAAGGQTNVEGAGIGGDIIWAGGSLNVNAPVNGNLHLSGGDVVINAPVKGNVTFKGGTLSLGEKAVVGGDLSYRAQKEATMAQGAKVNGKITFEPVQRAPNTNTLAALLSLALFAKFLATFVSALVLGLFFKRYVLTVVEYAVAAPLLEIGRGFATIILLPVASVLFFVTIVGIPLGLLGLIGFVALLIVSSLLATIVLGSLVHRSLFKGDEYQVTWITILLGVILYMLVGAIPFIGGIFKFLALLLALGASVRIKWGAIQEWR